MAGNVLGGDSGGDMSTTRLIVTTVIITLGIYDLCAVSFGGVDVSISRFFNGLSPYPGPVFVVGYICGHFWGFMTPLKQQPGKPAGDR